MRYYALATDYDGTLATKGQVGEHIVKKLMEFKASGRKAILVTGRELDDLKKVFPDLKVFDLVVAENGALLYDPVTMEETPLGEPPPPGFVEALRNKGVAPLSVGRVIVATWEPHEKAVLETIHEQGLEHQVIFNKGAVMILPSGINKAKGLTEALNLLGLSPHNVVGVGDAENDNALLQACECAVAVANALPSLKERADIVTSAERGEGVAELMDRILRTDLKELNGRLSRHHLLLGEDSQGKEVGLEPYGTAVLLAGSSGGGKSTFTTSFLERLIESEYEFCLIDPEGDYLNLEETVVLGDAEHPPVIEEAVKLLEKPGQNIVICTLAIPFHDRPVFFQRLFFTIMELRARTGRPHWLLVDEAHHLLPSARSSTLTNIPKELEGIFLITTKPELVNETFLSMVNVLITIGESPYETVDSYARATKTPCPQVPPSSLERGEAIIWRRNSGNELFWMRSVPPKTERRRHVRKYSKGELGDMSFYFRGPEGKLNLRAQNLMIFMQIAEGVDDETWMYHLKKKEYSEWFRRAIKDPVLIQEADRIEQMNSPSESRGAMKRLIEKRYTGAG